MAAIPVTYEGKDFLLDIEDMDTDDARHMEKIGVRNLKELQDGISVGDTSALTVAYWLMLKQNGEPGARIERVKFKPIKFLLALTLAYQDDSDDEGETPKE